MTQPFEPPKKKRSGYFAGLRSSFLTGLVVVLPIGLTAWLIWFAVGKIDDMVLPLVPDKFQPDIFLRNLFGERIGLGFGSDTQQTSIRGVGVFVFLLFTVFVGWIAKGFIGRQMLKMAEGMVMGVPVVRSIYNGVKQIAETVFSQKEASFEKACMIEYPRKGIWAIGFISTDARGEIAARGPNPDGDALVSVFLPTTPNPTSGFLLFFPKSDVVELDMSVEDAAKLVISAGLVYPHDKKIADAESK